MKEYKCISCGAVKQDNKRCTCPICGSMMYELPNERRTVLHSEVANFVKSVIDQNVDVNVLSFGKLKSDTKRFPDFKKIRHHVTKADKTELFCERLENSADQMYRYFHETFCKTYVSNCDQLVALSDNTADRLKNILDALGLQFEPDQAVFPAISVSYTERADNELIGEADELLKRVKELSEKIYGFVRVNNIYGRVYDIDVKVGALKNIPNNKAEWAAIISDKKFACDKVLEKKYVVDLFDDGTKELRSMLKVVWDAIYVLLKAPIKEKTYIYRLENFADKMNDEACSKKLKELYLERFDVAIKAINSADFLIDKSDEELFVLYNKMLELDVDHYMTGQKSLQMSGVYERRLNSLIGLESVKNSIRKIKAYALINKDSKKFNLHMCFLGNPGTGKTEVARIIAGILHENGLLPTSRVIETDRSGLVAGYVGQTALKTSEKIEEAMGGVLFIDEAYSLIKSETSEDYGHEAVATLLKAMEDSCGKLCVIFAGYKNQMTEMMTANPGLMSRIQFTIDFPNYDRSELGQITKLMADNRGYKISEAAVNRVLDITDYKRKEPNFANAREVRNIVEQVIMCQNLRCMDISDKTIEVTDVDTYIKDNNINLVAVGTGADKKILTAEERLEALVGLHSVKRMVKKIRAYAKRNKNDPDLDLHMCFCGDPGTGKTEVARILSGILYEAGVLPEAKLIETDSQGLISKYVGDTANKTLAKIKDSMGGVLFIDEAYSLMQGGENGYGDEAIAVLLKQMEDNRGKFCVIFAGYKDKMDLLLSTNPGLRSRIQFTLDFPDYSRKELSEIALKILKKKKYEIDNNALELLLNITEYYRTRPNFANARTVRNILEQVIMDQNLRTGDNDKDNRIVTLDVQDYIDDENIDLNSVAGQRRRIGF